MVCPQNQIAQQQALFMRQQSGGSDMYKQSHDPLGQLQNNFGDMSIAKDSQAVSGSSINSNVLFVDPV